MGFLRQTLRHSTAADRGDRQRPRATTKPVQRPMNKNAGWAQRYIALSNELYKSICNHCHLRHCRRISRHDHYRGWPRILVHRNIEESLCKGWLGIEPRWDHREVAVIAELVVDREAEQTDEELLPLHHDRHSRCERHRPRALHDKVDLV